MLRTIVSSRRRLLSRMSGIVVYFVRLVVASAERVARETHTVEAMQAKITTRIDTGSRIGFLVIRFGRSLTSRGASAFGTPRYPTRCHVLGGFASTLRQRPTCGSRRVNRRDNGQRLHYRTLRQLGLSARYPRASVVMHVCENMVKVVSGGQQRYQSKRRAIQ